MNIDGWLYDTNVCLKHMSLMISLFPGAPFLAILMSVYLYLAFGPSSLIGIGIMIMFLPIQVRRYICLAAV